MLLHGIVGAGGIFAGTNPAYTTYELSHHIRTAETKFLITEPEMLDSILVSAKECNIPKSRISIFNILGQPVPSGFHSWKTLFNHGEADWVRFDDYKTSSTTELARMSTSGTTGLPKAAIWTHHNLIAQHTLVWGHLEDHFEVRRLGVTPVFHAAAAPVTHATTLKKGQQLYLMRRFDFKQFLSNIEKYQITNVGMAPPMVIATVMSPLTKEYNLKSLKWPICGAAPLDKIPQKMFGELIEEGAPFTQVYGQ